MSTPEIDHFLAAVVDGAGGPQLTSLGEVAFKFAANFLKIRRRESFNQAWCAPCFRHLSLLLLWESRAAIPASRVPLEFYQPDASEPIEEIGQEMGANRTYGSGRWSQNHCLGDTVDYR